MFKAEDFPQLRTMAEINALHWEEFEWFCKYFLEHLGYERIQVTPKGEYGSDGGIDINCYKDKEKYLGQCKHWATGSHGFLPVRVVMEHAGRMEFHRIKRGIILTTLECSSMDYEAANRLHIQLIGKREIYQAMKKLQPEFGQA